MKRSIGLVLPLLIAFLISPPLAAQTASLSASSTRVLRLAPGVAQAQASFAIDAGARRLVIDIASPAANLQTSVELPGGLVVDPASAAGLGGAYARVEGTVDAGPAIYPFTAQGVHHVYRLPAATAGSLTVRVVTPGALAEDTAVAVQVSSDSPLGAHVLFSEAVVVAGRPVVLAAVVRDGAAPATNGSVVAQVFSDQGVAQLLLLADDGQGGDGAAGDGLYSAVFTPPAPGIYRAAVRMSGDASVGPYVREGGAVLQVVPSTGTLAGTARGRGVDLNGNGVLDRIAVDADFAAEREGTYRLFVRLANFGRKATASGDVVVTPGAWVATAHFDVDQLQALDLGQGPYTIEAVELAFVEPSGQVVPADRKSNLGQFSFVRSRFEGRPIAIWGASDSGFDGDGNGLFDALVVSLQVTAEKEGVYTATARLVDSSGKLVALGSALALLPAGSGDLRLSFDGRVISASRSNGPYSVNSLAITDGTPSASAAWLGRVATTQAYSLRQFEGAAFDQADRNSDGRVDCADVDVVRASFGRRAGETGFDWRADVVEDGAVNALDLAFVRGRLPSGLVCP